MITSSFDPKTQIVSVSDSGGAYLKQMQAQHPGQIIRFSTKKAGCSGFAYTLDFVDSAKQDDLCVEPTDGLKIFVDSTSLPMIKGTEIDL
jgi:iron-sulfur cluster assembly protein